MQLSAEILISVAYVNPGSGLLLLQLIIAGMIGFLFVFRRALTRIVRLGRIPKALPLKEDLTDRLGAPIVAKTAEPLPKSSKH